MHTAKTDMEAQTCTVVGTMKEEKLINYLYKKLKKRAEIVPEKDDSATSKKEDDKGKSNIVLMCCCHECHCIPPRSDEVEDIISGCRMM